MEEKLVLPKAETHPKANVQAGIALPVFFYIHIYLFIVDSGAV